MSLYIEKRISLDILELYTSLVEITGICYMHYNQRSPKQILRLYNQTFKFSYLCKSLIGIPKKMTSRRFYGSYFHSLTVHAPRTNKIFCLRSITPEQEEWSFGDLRNISLQTSNRQCWKVIDNAMLRFINHQKNENQVDYTKIQESITCISHQAKLLPAFGDTRFSIELLKNRQTLFQKHFKRIANFLLPGENHWWSFDGKHIIFDDGPSRPDFCGEPMLQHFYLTTSEKQDTLLNETWNKCIEELMSGKLQLPVLKVKLYEDGKLQKL